jgi:hypothetical protein
MKKFFLYTFCLLTLWGPNSFSENFSKIDLNKSFIDIIAQYSWRTNISASLTTENKKFYLTKEIRAEKIGDHPFFRYPAYRFFTITENDKIYIIKTPSTDRGKKNVVLNTSLKTRKNIVESNTNYLNFEEVYEILLSGKIKNIYSEIEYEYEGIKYNLITKCDYINYGSDKDKNDVKFIQIVNGYVPFVHKNQLKYGYAALYISEKKKGYLEFVLNEKNSIFNVDSKQNLINLYTKKILNALLFFYKKNDFTEIISIKESKINFFSYN